MTTTEVLARLASAAVLPIGDGDAVTTVGRIHGLLRDAGVALPLRLWDGTARGPADAPFRVVLPQPGSLRALLPPSDLRAGQAYVEGHIDIEGDAVAALQAVDDLLHADLPRAALARILVEVARLPLLPPPPHPVPAPAQLQGRPHAPERDRAAVQFHYDVGNDFFALFLDRDLVYSCAHHLHEDEPLEVAQRRKLDVVCRKLRLQAGDRLLDVGCGWGSLAIHAARAHGAQVVGITLSEAQAELAARRVAAAGVADRVEIRLQDYREVPAADAGFDAIASIGMLEHVGPDHLDAYCRTLRDLLAPGGRLLNHGITTGRRMGTTDFTRDPPTFVGRHVFPDGGLVPAWRAVQAVEVAGLEVRDLEQLRPAYALTLREWTRRLEAAWDEAVAVAGEATARVWRLYMAGSAAAFERGDLGVVQVLATTADGYGPLGRSWMMPAR